MDHPHNKNIIYKNPKVKHRFDKQLVCVNNTTNNAASNTALTAAANFPYVIMGIIISGSSSTLVAVNIPFAWCVSVVPQGTALSAMTIANGANMYTPEQLVLAFGSGTVQSGTTTSFFVKTKTGRKINTGDQVFFQMVSTTANVVQHTYVVQYFFKT